MLKCGENIYNIYVTTVANTITLTNPDCKLEQAIDSSADKPPPGGIFGSGVEANKTGGVQGGAFGSGDGVGNRYGGGGGGNGMGGGGAEEMRMNPCPERQKQLECLSMAKGISLDHPQTRKNFLVGVLPKSKNEFALQCESVAKYEECLRRNNLTEICADDPLVKQMTGRIKFMCEEPQKSGKTFCLKLKDFKSFYSIFFIWRNRNEYSMHK